MFQAGTFSLCRNLLSCKEAPLTIHTLQTPLTMTKTRPYCRQNNDVKSFEVGMGSERAVGSASFINHDSLGLREGIRCNEQARMGEYHDRRAEGLMWNRNQLCTSFAERRP